MEPTAFDDAVMVAPDGSPSAGCTVKNTLSTIQATVTASAAMNITAPTARPETRCGCCCIDLILGARDAMW
jgi:hypothetical protein